MESDKKTLIRIGAGVSILLAALIIFVVKERLSAENDISVISSETVVSEEAVSAEKKPDEISQVIQESASEGGVGAQGESAFIIVDVGGAVKCAGIAKLKTGSRVYEAVEQAGGLREDADTFYINMAAFLTDGDKIYIPSRKETAAAEKEGGRREPEAGAGLISGAVQSGQAPAAFIQPGAVSQTESGVNDKVNLNTADSQQLQTLKGIGPATAEKILDYRIKNGNFKRIEDIKNVSGIGEKSFEKLKDKICI